MVEAALDDKTSERYHALHTLNWGIRVVPGLPPRKLQRAFKKLTARHQSLRLRIVEHKGDWAAEVLPEHPVGLVVEEFGPLSREDQITVVAEKCSAPMSALDPVLFEARLLRFGSEGDILLTRAQHAIIDGYSIAILIEEFVAYVLNLPVVGTAPSHKDFVERRAQLINLKAKAKRGFWEDTLLPAPPPLNLGRQRKGLPPLTRQNMGPTHKLEEILSPEASARLKEMSRSSGASPFSQVQAAFGNVVCDTGEGSEAMWICMMGRQDAKMSKFIGAEMQGIRMKYASASGADALTDVLSRSADMLPADCFHPDEPLGQIYFQFFMNMPKPMGRIANSAFGKVFDAVLSGGFSMGGIVIERVPIPILNETEFELQMLFEPTPDEPQATFLADAASWDMPELEGLAKSINENILA